MKKYEYLPHTADAKFRAYGKNIEEAFQNAALAMANITFKSAEIKPKIKKEIKVKAESLKELLITFLDEFVFLQDTEGFLLGDVYSLKITQEKKNEIIKENKKTKKEEKTKTLYKLYALITGDHYKNYAMQGQVAKAVTYNDMLIEEKNGGWLVQVVVDI